MNLKPAVTLFLIFLCTRADAQVVKSVVLDSVVIASARSGFDVADFIEMVKADTSFRSGFRNLRNSRHRVRGDMTLLDRKNRPDGFRHRNATQHVELGKRWIEINEEKADKRFYNRRDEPRTYTAELFDALFFYTDTLPVSSVNSPLPAKTNEQDRSNTAKLKTLVFNPGTPVDGVPVVGKRVAIFDADMVPYYDYSITVKTYADSIPCYVFSCRAKPGAGDYPVLRTLNTWFDRRNFQIVYRDYSYRYSGLLFDFDVSMKVVMDYANGMLYPKRIEYHGYWDLPFRKKEAADFQLQFELIHD